MKFKVGLKLNHWTNSLDNKNLPVYSKPLSNLKILSLSLIYLKFSSLKAINYPSVDS